jgi:hypothetical protein
MVNNLDSLKEEHRDLEQRLNALESFIFSNPKFKTLDGIEQSRMIKQSGYMESYLRVLGSRIWCAVENMEN